MSKPMTNYNERLDEVLTHSLKRAYFNGSTDAKARESGVIPNDTKLGEVMVQVLVAEAKQAITSLIKELVAEAKPERKSTEDYGSWEDGHRNAAWNKCLEHFEQNLLKALETWE